MTRMAGQPGGRSRWFGPGGRLMSMFPCQVGVITASCVLVTLVVLAYLTSPARRPADHGGSPWSWLLSNWGADNNLRASTKKYGSVVTGAGTTSHRTLVVSGQQASYWHDIPWSAADLDEQHLVPMVVEIPRGATAKMEINKAVAHNPIIQDVKNGAPRYYPMPSVVNYGALPRTYEHPDETDVMTGLAGDGDPIDVVDVSDSAVPVNVGEVVLVRIVGALAMEDDDAADWKIVVVRMSDPVAAVLTDLRNVTRVQHVAVSRGGGGEGGDGDGVRVTTVINEAPPYAALPPPLKRVADRLRDMVTFFADYKKKKPTDPSPVKFAFDADYLDAETAVGVVRQHHIHWCSLVDAAASGRRVSALPPAFHEYQMSCDDARTQWAAQLEVDETQGAAAGAAASLHLPDGVWVAEFA